MPHSRPENLPCGSERWPAIGASGFRSVQWGDMEVGFTTVHAPLDCTEVCKMGGLPGGVCPCPHYGYMFEGRLRAKFPGTDWPDELIEAGEVFFIEGGHVLVYEVASRVLEFNPAHALQTCMNAMQRALQRSTDDVAAAKSAE